MFITKREHDRIVAAEHAVTQGWKSVAADYKQMLLELQGIVARTSASHAAVLGPDDVEPPKTVQQGDAIAVAKAKADAQVTKP